MDLLSSSILETKSDRSNMSPPASVFGDVEKISVTYIGPRFGFWKEVIEQNFLEPRSIHQYRRIAEKFRYGDDDVT
jgi:hypothetical protein